MAIGFESEVHDGILFVKAEGTDESTEQVLDYGRSVIRAAAKSGCTRVLCDEREVAYSLGTGGTIEAAERLVEHVPRVCRVAIVCSRDCLEEGRLWETVAGNRGLIVRVDTDPERAEAWITEDRRSGGEGDPCGGR